MQGPLEESYFGKQSEINPGLLLVERLYDYVKSRHPKTLIMASGLRTKQGEREGGVRRGGKEEGGRGREKEGGERGRGGANTMAFCLLQRRRGAGLARLPGLSRALLTFPSDVGLVTLQLCSLICCPCHLTLKSMPPPLRQPPTTHANTTMHKHPRARGPLPHHPPYLQRPSPWLGVTSW